MRDVVRHTMYQVPGSTAQLLDDADDPRRMEYLARFADREGQVFLRRFWRKYQGKTPDEVQEAFLDGLRPGAERLAAVFRYLSPQASPDELAAFLRKRLDDAELTSARVEQLYKRTAPEAYDLPDRGYVARVHPLELWLVGYLSAKPEASWQEAVVGARNARRSIAGCSAPASRGRRIRASTPCWKSKPSSTSTGGGAPGLSLRPCRPTTALGSSGDRLAARPT